CQQHNSYPPWTF
nr:immunoglobulin light chain junction region [Macaca mulatta]